MISTPRPVSRPYFPYEFHLSRQAWERFRLDTLGTAAGQPAARVQAARLLAERLNTARHTDPGSIPPIPSIPSMEPVPTLSQEPARAGELLALGLLTEVLRHLVNVYCEEVLPGVLLQGIEYADRISTSKPPSSAAPAFVRHFPPAEVLRKEQREEEYLKSPSQPLTNLEIVAREILLLEVTLENPAASRYRLLHDPTQLAQEAPLAPLIQALEKWLDAQPVLPLTNESLLATLRAPIRNHPHSIEAQLDYIREYWHPILPPALLEELSIVRGVLREETMMRGGGGPGPIDALDFRHGGGRGPGGMLSSGRATYLEYEEVEAFSVDKDWMPKVVLLAKTVFVWLDQLSKQYQRPIHRLDQIPDEELDKLRHWGVTGLWLIGLWERSPASRTIKRIMGNPEAEASAYSLYDYQIAWELGGQPAYENLLHRAWQRGIRLASDMVPNHVGIYSRWVVEHPDWFIQLYHPPYPAYTFNGPNLSSDDRVGLFIEDGYWEKRDAAVVFKRVDMWTGETRYIYHGNDGTNMPWNDTAQLNFLLPQVREAVIQTILHVARQFRIIRFDAAMTLAKQHFQRLWYPKPGDGGAVPSRAEHGMSKAAFDHVFPLEFWREVVDRVQQEVPDTLLLAEAFWLMEGYFVRTLGMHRVYNSAFMNMLKMEENAKYRQTIKNVLEFSPEVLQRFVNFMNNPDEDTAEAQFGRGDKYFGVSVLLATMPGLPMLGHGQIEGYTEKYGMEYRRAYKNEDIDWGLVHRHEREIFPILRQRHLFSGARHFALYDFVTADGGVDENVFAYSNRAGEERSLILYNNAFGSTRGVIHTSTSINEGTTEHEHLRRVSLAEALHLNTCATCYYIYCDYRSGLEYLRHGRELAEFGLHTQLNGYQYLALLNWREVQDYDLSWGRLHEMLGGQGVPSVEEAYLEMRLAPILDPFRKVVTPANLQALFDRDKKGTAAFEADAATFVQAVAERLGEKVDAKPLVAAMSKQLKHVPLSAGDATAATSYTEIADYLLPRLPTDRQDFEFWRVPLVWALLRPLGMIAAKDPQPARAEVEAISGEWIHEWFLAKPVARAFEELTPDRWRAQQDARLVYIAVAHAHHFLALETEIWGPILDILFDDPEVRRFLLWNEHAGRKYINQEQLERLLFMLYLVNVLHALSETEVPSDRLMICLENIQALQNAAADASYDAERMIDALK